MAAKLIQEVLEAERLNFSRLSKTIGRNYFLFVY
jgi:hypothetical protein